MPLGSDVFERRRRHFMKAIGEGAAALFPAARERLRSNDVEYRFRQQSDFHYLTGFPEPDAVCLLLPGHAKEEYVLFVRPRDPEREVWTGRRVGVDGAVEQFGACVAHAIEQLDQMMPEYLADRERLYYVMDRDERFNRRVMCWLQQTQASWPHTGKGAAALLDARGLLHEMRLHKEPRELDCMRRASRITVDAHMTAIREVRPGQHEYEIEALIEYVFRSSGAVGPAYPSVVASGNNATALHYTSNDRVMRRNDIVLVDAGAEYEAYCADVARSFPVGRCFTARQRAIYETVLRAQLAGIEAVRPGAPFDAVHRAAVKVLIDGLLALGLLRGSASQAEKRELYRPFFMHKTSHWLGLDVHDAGPYKRGEESRALEPGMVLTVEPGIYISNDRQDVSPKWRGIGVRIEDDVLVTADGHEVLSAALPKQVGDIEAMRRDTLRRGVD